jgi:hypothetical protein
MFCAPFVLALSIACFGQTEPRSISVPDDSVSGVAAVRLSVDEAVAAALESNPEIRAAVRRLSLAQMKTNHRPQPRRSHAHGARLGYASAQAMGSEPGAAHVRLQQTFPRAGRSGISAQGWRKMMQA